MSRLPTEPQKPWWVVVPERKRLHQYVVVVLSYKVHPHVVIISYRCFEWVLLDRLFANCKLNLWIIENNEFFVFYGIAKETPKSFCSSEKITVKSFEWLELLYSRFEMNNLAILQPTDRSKSSSWGFRFLMQNVSTSSHSQRCGGQIQMFHYTATQEDACCHCWLSGSRSVGSSSAWREMDVRTAGCLPILLHQWWWKTLQHHASWWSTLFQ